VFPKRAIDCSWPRRHHQSAQFLLAKQLIVHGVVIGEGLRTIAAYASPRAGPGPGNVKRRMPTKAEAPP